MVVNWKGYIFIALCASVVCCDPIANRYLYDNKQVTEVANNIPSDILFQFTNFRSKDTSFNNIAKRRKRSIIRYNYCPVNYIWYLVKCIPCSEFEDYTGLPCP